MQLALGEPWDGDANRGDGRLKPEAPRSIKVAVFTRGLAAGSLTLLIGLSIALEYSAQTDRRSMQERMVVSDREGLIMALAFSPDGRDLAVTSSKGRVSIWDVAARRKRLELDPPFGGSGLAFSPDGRTVAVTDRGPVIRTWNCLTGASLTSFEAPGEDLGTVAFSPDGRLLAASCSGGGVTLWDVASGQIRVKLPGYGHSGNAFAFSPDGRTMAISGKDGAVDFRDVADGRVRATFERHRSSAIREKGGIVSAAFSPDGKFLATAGAFDPLLKVWDVAEGRLIMNLVIKAHVVTFVSFLSRGRTVLWADQEGTVRSWNLDERRPEVVIDGLDHRHLRAALAPDGKTLAVGEAESLSLWSRPQPSGAFTPDTDRAKRTNDDQAKRTPRSAGRIRRGNTSGPAR